MLMEKNVSNQEPLTVSWDERGVKIVSLEALNSDVLFMHAHMWVHTHTHT